MKKKSVLPRRGGRPTEQDAAQIRDKILDIASAMFLADGYGAVSIEAIAKRAAISKRTFYTRFADKAALFAAVVERLVGRMRPPNPELLFIGTKLEDILVQLARIILVAAIKPEALALHRLMMSEAGRFPELSTIMEREGSRREAITRIADLLRHHLPEIKLDTSFAAEQFLQMVTAAPQTAFLHGRPMTALALNRWADDTARLFLRGLNGY